MALTAEQAVEAFPASSSRRSVWLAFLVLALLLHLFLLRLQVPWNTPSQPAPVEVTPIDPAKLDAVKKQWKQSERQLLLNENPAEKSEVAPPDNARYSSDRNIRVEKEQRARNADVIPRAEKHAGQGSRSAAPPAPQLGNLGVPMELTRKAQARPQTPRQQAGGRDHENQSSAHQQLQDRSLPIGGENLLNAQESVFYSFYARLYESIGPIWQSDIRATRPDRTILPGDYQTLVDVVLDQDGTLLEVRLLQSSGVEAFDEAVHRSWSRMTRFPNPPKGLLDASGRVHMGWSFTVQVDSSFGFQYLPPERQS